MIFRSNDNTIASADTGNKITATQIDHENKFDRNLKENPYKNYVTINKISLKIVI